MARGTQDAAIFQSRSASESVSDNVIVFDALAVELDPTRFAMTFRALPRFELCAFRELTTHRLQASRRRRERFHQAWASQEPSSPDRRAQSEPPARYAIQA